MFHAMCNKINDYVTAMTIYNLMNIVNWNFLVKYLIQK